MPVMDRAGLMVTGHVVGTGLARDKFGVGPGAGNW